MIKHQFPDYDSEIEANALVSRIKDELYWIRDEMKKMKVLIQKIEDKLKNMTEQTKEKYDV